MSRWETPPQDLVSWIVRALLLAGAAVLLATLVPARSNDGTVRVTPPDGTAVTASEDIVAWTAPRPDSWRPIPPAPIAARLDHVAVWTGREVVVWGGFDQFGRPLTDGAQFDPRDGSWSRLPANRARRPASAGVWSGSEVVLTAPDATWRYDPVSRRWRSSAPVPVPDDHVLDDRVVAVNWNVVAITEPFDPDGRPAVFSLAPGADAWESLPPLPLTLTRAHVVLTSGTRILVFGPPAVRGQPSSLILDTDGREPAWRQLAGPPDLDHLSLRTLVGGVGESTIVLWGARSGDGSGWTAVWNGRRWASGDGGPLQAGWSTVGVWIGDRLLVWDRAAGIGAVYDPGIDRWRSLPEPMFGGVGVRQTAWTGRSLFVWGSFGSVGALVRPD